MSSRILFGRATSAAAGRPGSVTAAVRRTIAASTRLDHKETTSHQPDHEVDKHKLDSLKKQAQGRGHWKSELASESEEAVKADRAAREAAGAGRNNADETVRRMQDQTKHAAEETSKWGTSMRDGL